MTHIFGAIQTVAFCLTLLGMAFLAAMAVPGSNLPSLVVSFAKWCVAALDAAKRKKSR